MCNGSTWNWRVGSEELGNGEDCDARQEDHVLVSFGTGIENCQCSYIAF